MDPEGSRTGDTGTQEIDALRERVRALEATQAKLRETIATYEQILDVLPDLICAQRKDGRFLYANRSFCEFYGKPRAELIGAAQGDIIFASTAEAHAERRERLFSSGIFIDIASEKLKRSDGLELPYNVVWCPVRGAAGEINAMVVHARGLRINGGNPSVKGHAETHARALLNIIPDMYFRVDRSGTYTEFSAGRGLDTALPPSLFLGKRVVDVTPDVATWSLAAAEEALRTGEVQRHEYSMFVQGVNLDYEARVIPSGPDDVIFLVREITSQKKVEQKLREADARFRAFEEQRMFGIFIVQEGTLRYTSPKLASIVGATPDELKASGLPLTLADREDRGVLEAFLSELEAEGKRGADTGVQRTFRALRRDGEVIYIDIFGSKVSYGGEPAVIGVVLDVTDIRRAEEERARLQEEMMRIQEAVMVELSTPLIPISDDVLVMPLIGTVDDKRAQHVMERLLHGVSTTRAKAVIIDVTGMPSVKPETASSLVRCAQAVGLLGAKALLTGVRADVAQTLVTMGVDLSGIVTLSTLKVGIAYATGRAIAKG